MLRPFAILACVALVGGCAVEQVSRVGPNARDEITYAAQAIYPGNAELSDTMRLAAIDRPSRHELEIVNLTNETILSASVWVNGIYVTRIDPVPARGTTTISYSDLLEAGRGTSDLRSVGQSATRVELEVGGKLYSVQGPAKQ